jgi:hypothetical protein
MAHCRYGCSRMMTHDSARASELLDRAHPIVTLIVLSRYASTPQWQAK